jgi:hypothetical protein
LHCTGAFEGIVVVDVERVVGNVVEEVGIVDTDVEVLVDVVVDVLDLVVEYTVDVTFMEVVGAVVELKAVVFIAFDTWPKSEPNNDSMKFMIPCSGFACSATPELAAPATETIEIMQRMPNMAVGRVFMGVLGC